MGKIKPVLSLTSNASSAGTHPGPLSVALNLTATPTKTGDSGLLTVDVVNTEVIAEVSQVGSPVGEGFNRIIQGADHGTAIGGTVGCWVYLKNTTTSGTEKIYIGHMGDGDYNSPSDIAYNNITVNDQYDRIFTLKAGEFAFFPYDYTGDLIAVASAAGQSLEYWTFDR
tara:strand:- start:1617 stop:2123 length:507 start_codon:yes stop_codon:yes gene_type:complete